jgi:Sec-independent protein translocase protein TatA
MDIFGIGPLELFFIIIIILLVMGPKEMVNSLRTLGSWLRKIVMSDWWRTTRQTLQDVRKLPYEMMRDAGLEEDLKALDEIRQTAAGKSIQERYGTARKPDQPDFSAWTGSSLPLQADNPKPQETQDSQQTILPPQNAKPSIETPDLNPAEKSTPTTEEKTDD